MNSDINKLSLQPRVRYRAVAEDGVLVHMDTGRVMVVNEVGLSIIESLNHPISKSDLVKKVTEEFEVTQHQAATDVESFLAELENEQLLVSSCRPEAKQG